MSRYKPVGWRNESYRHSLASRGIRTGSKAQGYKVVGAKARKEYHTIPIGTSIQRKYYSITRDYDGKLKLSLGNFTDAGWFWDGDESDMLLFLERVRNSSFRDSFISQMKVSNIEFDDVKEQILKNIEKGDDGIYALSGDNALWHFGQGDEPYIEDELSDLGLSPEKKDQLNDKFWENYKGMNYDDFLKEKGEEVKEEIKEAVDKSSNFEDFFINLQRVDDNTAQILFEYQLDLVNDALYKSRDELGV